MSDPQKERATSGKALVKPTNPTKAPDAPSEAVDRPSEGLEPPGWLGRFRELQLPTYLEKWRDRIRTDPRTGLPLSPLNLPDGTTSIEKLAFESGQSLRLALKLFTPAALTVFVISFVVPWPGLAQVLRACATAGLIGFGTNWVAIQMLFRPREVRPILGQGLIPSQRDELIRKVADEVTENLINEDIIRRELDESRLITRLTQETVKEVRRVVHDPEFVGDTRQVILTYAAKLTQSEKFRMEVIGEVQSRMEQVTGTQFAQAVVERLRGLWQEPLLRAVNKELDELPDTLDRLVGDIDSALDHIPHYLERHQETIEAALTRITMSMIREIDVRRVITKQLSTVTSEQLEVGFREFADDKLGYITLLGGILGVVGGLVIVWPLYSIAAIFLLASMLGAMDIVVYRLLNARRR